MLVECPCCNEIAECDFEDVSKRQGSLAGRKEFAEATRDGRWGESLVSSVVRWVLRKSGLVSTEAGHVSDHPLVKCHGISKLVPTCGDDGMYLTVERPDIHIKTFTEPPFSEELSRALGLRLRFHEVKYLADLEIVWYKIIL